MRNPLFQSKSFLFYLFGQAVSSLGDGLYLVAFMWLAMKLSGGKGIVLGGVFSIYTLCEIIFGFVAGPVADRFNKKGILITVDVIRGLAILVLFFLIQFNGITIFHLYIITFFFAAVSPFFHRTEFTIIPQIAEKVRLGSSGYGFMMGAISAGLIASSLLVGFIEKFLKVIKILLFGLIVSATAIGLMGLSSISVIIIFAAFMMGVGINLSNLPIVTLFQKNIPETKIGVVSSFVFTVAQVAMPVSMLLSGYLVGVFSLSAIFLGIGIIVFLGVIVGFALPQFRAPELQICPEFEPPKLKIETFSENFAYKII